MNKTILRPEDIDNPWRRLHWVLPSTFLVWGALLWVFGLLLGRVAAGIQEQSKTIDAQIIELPAPIKHAIVPKAPVKKVVPKATPQKQPAPMISTSPAVSVPEMKAPPSNLTTPFGGIVPVVKGTPPGPPQGPPQGRGEAIAPPEFGAAYLKNPKPEYPVFARRMRMEGTVMLKVLVSRQGTAVKVEVAQTSGYEILDKAAAESVKNWQFVPARQGDKPLEEWVQVPVAFSLRK